VSLSPDRSSAIPPSLQHFSTGYCTDQLSSRSIQPNRHEIGVLLLILAAMMAVILAFRVIQHLRWRSPQKDWSRLGGAGGLERRPAVEPLRPELGGNLLLGIVGRVADVMDNCGCRGPVMVLLYFAAVRDLRPPSSATHAGERFVWLPEMAPCLRSKLNYSGGSFVFNL
jgi:hypothetical protein